MNRDEIIRLLDNTLESIWKDEIKSDYECGWLLKEDTLKNAIYFHLRNKLNFVFEENVIRIFTKFTDCEFKVMGYRPDIVVARVNMEAPSNYLGDDVIECLAVIEVKYKSGFTTSNEILADYEKLKCYSQKLGITAKLHMATIWEYEAEAVSWERKNAAWVKGKLTELNASYVKGNNNDMHFYVFRH